MTIDELRGLYHDSSIPKKARSEIKLDFMAKFGYATSQQFVTMLALGSLILPTPNEFDWLAEKVQRYYDYYNNPGKVQGQQMELAVTAKDNV